MPAAKPATILLRRFEKAHPIDLAQRAQRVKAGLPPEWRGADDTFYHSSRLP
jgi:hypothetical protein